VSAAKKRKRPKRREPRGQERRVGGLALAAILNGMGEEAIELAQRRLQLLKDEARFQEHSIASMKFAMRAVNEMVEKAEAGR
jgi:hypothetical protein